MNKIISEVSVDIRVNKMLENAGYIEKRGWIIEPQKSSNKIIQKCLRNASKNNGKNIGKPDFIVWNPKENTVIVIEDKMNNPFKAIEEAKWYAEFIKEKFNVIAIGISSIKGVKNFIIESFYFEKNIESFFELGSKKIYKYSDYKKQIEDKKISDKPFDEVELSKLTKIINQKMRDDMGINERKRPFLAATILIALKDLNFKLSYMNFKETDTLANYLLATIERIMEDWNYATKDINNLISSVDFIRTIKDKSFEKIHSLYNLVNFFRERVFEKYKESNIDIVGKFYTDFLKYATNGGGDLGIVLTPAQITDLFLRLTQADENSRVLDVAMGTGGFLIQHWKQNVYSKYKNDKDSLKIKEKNILGIEFEPEMFALAQLNMKIHNDGGGMLLRGSCFDKEIIKKIKSKKPNILLMNPPYSDKNHSELDFLINALDMMENSSMAAIIIPNKTTDNEISKKILLENHTLVASIKMPKDLFYPVATETVVLVFKTGVKHNFEEPVWFSEFDDGYIKAPKMGRLKTLNANEKIKRFIKVYKAKEDSDFSNAKCIKDYSDSWLFVDHKNTHSSFEEISSNIPKKILENENFNYKMSKGRYTPMTIKSKVSIKPFPVKEFQISDIFEIKRGKRFTAFDRRMYQGEIPFVTASENNNGIDLELLINEQRLKSIDEFAITLNVFGKPFYQNFKFGYDDNVARLKLKNSKFKDNYFVNIFLIASLEKLSNIYSYGDKLQNAKRFNEVKISVPVKNGEIDFELMIRTVKSFIC